MIYLKFTSNYRIIVIVNYDLNKYAKKNPSSELIHIIYLYMLNNNNFQLNSYINAINIYSERFNKS